MIVASSLACIQLTHAFPFHAMCTLENPYTCIYNMGQQYKSDLGTGIKRLISWSWLTHYQFNACLLSHRAPTSEWSHGFPFEVTSVIWYVYVRTSIRVGLLLSGVNEPEAIATIITSAETSHFNYTCSHLQTTKLNRSYCDIMDFTRVVASLWIVLASCASVYRAQDESSVYHFALMVSTAPTLNTSGVVQAVDQTLDVINRPDSNVLPGVRLQYTNVLDTQVSNGIITNMSNWWLKYRAGFANSVAHNDLYKSSRLIAR